MLQGSEGTSHVGAESVNTTPWRDARPAGAEAPADNGDIAALARARSCLGFEI